jgi:hypothetical protein
MWTSLFSAFWPLILIAIFFGIYYIPWRRKQRNDPSQVTAAEIFSEKEGEAVVERHFERYRSSGAVVRVAICVALFSYPSVMFSGASYFVCESVPPYGSLLKADYR